MFDRVSREPLDSEVIQVNPLQVQRSSVWLQIDWCQEE